MVRLPKKNCESQFLRNWFTSTLNRSTGEKIHQSSFSQGDKAAPKEAPMCQKGEFAFAIEINESLYFVQKLRYFSRLPYPAALSPKQRNSPSSLSAAAGRCRTVFALPFRVPPPSVGAVLLGGGEGGREGGTSCLSTFRDYSGRGE